VGELVVAEEGTSEVDLRITRGSPVVEKELASLDGWSGSGGPSAFGQSISFVLSEGSGCKHKERCAKDKDTFHIAIYIVIINLNAENNHFLFLQRYNFFPQQMKKSKSLTKGDAVMAFFDF